MASTPEPSLILASASTARAAVLRAAGLDFTVEPANLDEARVKRTLRHVGAASCALALAGKKACVVSWRFPAAFVIGADQLLVAGEEWFDKPCDVIQARAQLCALRGQTHRLVTAACVVQHGSVLWQMVAQPELSMRRFSDSFLDAYLAAEGESLLGSVGAYRVEERGIQLFSRISGDYFAVLGLPIIELLAFLRDCGVVPE